MSLNFSYTVYVFHVEPLTLDFIQATRNKTHTYKTSVVPNDPADFGRNSYQSSTLNSIFESLKHSSIDILKIESLADNSNSHEVLYYMVKDHLLRRVRQLHLALYIGKKVILLLQTTLFIPTLDTMTKFVIMTISLSQNRRLRGSN